MAIGILTHSLHKEPTWGWECRHVINEPLTICMKQDKKSLCGQGDIWIGTVDLQIRKSTLRGVFWGSGQQFYVQRLKVTDKQTNGVFVKLIQDYQETGQPHSHDTLKQSFLWGIFSRTLRIWCIKLNPFQNICSFQDPQFKRLYMWETFPRFGGRPKLWLSWEDIHLDGQPRTNTAEVCHELETVYS